MESLPPSRLYSLKTEEDFLWSIECTLRFQYTHNSVYHDYCEHLGFHPDHFEGLASLPFLPIEFFKTHKIVTHPGPYDLQFQSSGTTGQQKSTHYLLAKEYYIQSFVQGFTQFYGPIDDYCLLALLPNYLEQGHSSLVFMVQKLIELGGNPMSGFFLKDFEQLLRRIDEVRRTDKKILLIGVSFALLDLAELYKPDLSDVIIMETGGMKGRRRELIRAELHHKLNSAFQTKSIHSEYGMTELLSQSYSLGNGLFKSPFWKRVLIREAEDPLSLAPSGKSGGINIIDLSNQYSCSFIATQDLGRWHEDGFEVLGRFDHADVRGCNLMVAH